MLWGMIRHKHKLKLLAEADLAINPMLTGAGVNLKTLEFLSAGIPLFSTMCGVRGLDLIDRKHFVHAEKEDFAEILQSNYLNKSLLQEVSTNGQKHINEHYSWKSIAQNMKNEIEKIRNY
jgi:glycosyltransferase involved in cell wall biosynthesis